MDLSPRYFYIICRLHQNEAPPGLCDIDAVFNSLVSEKRLRARPKDGLSSGSIKREVLLRAPYKSGGEERQDGKVWTSQQKKGRDDHVPAFEID